MLYLAYDAGLRISELVNLHLASLNQPELDQVRVLGKGRRRRVLPLWKATSAALHNWIGVRPRTRPAPVPQFLQERHDYTGLRQARRSSCRYGRDGCSFHRQKDRGSPFATTRLRLSPFSATNDIRQVSTWLGHADQKTTETYLRLDPAEKLKIQSRQKQPEISAGSFEGVEDELLAALAKIKTSSS